MNATPFYLGSHDGTPHFRHIDTRTDAMPVTEFEDTNISIPAPFYGTATGQHRHPWPTKLRARRALILAIALVGLCAAPIIFFVK